MEKKHGGHLDRIIMGAIIGGAIASVIGRKLSKKNKGGGAVSGLEEQGQGQKKKGFFRRMLGL